MIYVPLPERFNRRHEFGVLYDSGKERSLPFEINKKWEIEMLGGWREGGRVLL